MNYSEITPYIRELAALSDKSNHIVPEMYAQHDVKRGLRDINGNGVVAGLTEVSRIKAKDKDAEGNEIPCEGQLYYRGINVRISLMDFLTMIAPDLRKQSICFCSPNCQTKKNLDSFVSSYLYIVPCLPHLFVI